MADGFFHQFFFHCTLIISIWTIFFRKSKTHLPSTINPRDESSIFFQQRKFVTRSITWSNPTTGEFEMAYQYFEIFQNSCRNFHENFFHLEIFTKFSIFFFDFQKKINFQYVIFTTLNYSDGILPHFATKINRTKMWFHLGWA